MYNITSVIRSFQDKDLERCWRQDKCGKIPAPLRRRTKMKLDMMDVAVALQDLASPPGNKLHQLSGDRARCWAIAVSGPWRLVFRWNDGYIDDVLLEQYH